ncbi:MAG: thioredoxin family protein [Peptococcaceae bacterium]|nr:thioredoxin family protein [Peptococcaceae bacterium]MDH7525086.1 thioredoxin family protein [Peptococcaceae bacterium]
MDIRIYAKEEKICNRIERDVIRALAVLDVIAYVDVVSDPGEIREAGIVTTPCLTINGNPKVYGSIPSKDEIIQFIKEEL